MIAKIQQLEQITRQLEPSSAQRKAWMDVIYRYADDFLQTLPTAKAFIEHKDWGKGLLDFSIEENAKPLNKLIDALEKHVDNEGLNAASGGHLGYIPGGGLYPAALGDFLAAVMNRYAGIFFSGPGAVRMENQLIRWMCKMVGYPETALGNLTSGGSISGLIAIVAARDHCKIHAEMVPKSVIYLTDHINHSVQKAIRIAGLVEAQLRYVPLDEYYRMDAKVLTRWVQEDKTKGLHPFLIIASAGTTQTGAIDPLNQLADIAEQENLWLHADAAYGGFFMLLDELKDSFVGIERSDSITIDPHKSLFLPYGSGALLIKNIEALQQSHYYLAPYMQDTYHAIEEASPADLSPELSKHFRGLRMWLPLQLYGIRPFRASLEEKVLLCRYFYEEIQKLGFEVGPYPDLTVAIYRYIPTSGSADSFNQLLVKETHLDGRVFLTSTVIDDKFWLRIAVVSFRTHLDTINLCLEMLKECVERVKATWNVKD